MRFRPARYLGLCVAERRKTCPVQGGLGGGSNSMGSLRAKKKGTYLCFKQTAYSRLPCAGSIPVGWPRIVRSFMIV